MHVSLNSTEIEFRDTVRRFFAEKFPDDIRERVLSDVPLRKEDYVRWQKLLNQQGWSAVNWPVESGRHRLVALCSSTSTPMRWRPGYAHLT